MKISTSCHEIDMFAYLCPIAQNSKLICGSFISFIGNTPVRYEAHNEGQFFRTLREQPHGVHSHQNQQG